MCLPDQKLTVPMSVYGIFLVSSLFMGLLAATGCSAFFNSQTNAHGSSMSSEPSKFSGENSGNVNFQRIEESIPIGQRVRDVRQGPDGLLYILTDEANGQLLRLEPVAS